MCARLAVGACAGFDRIGVATGLTASLEPSLPMEERTEFKNWHVSSASAWKWALTYTHDARRSVAVPPQVQGHERAICMLNVSYESGTACATEE